LIVDDRIIIKFKELIVSQKFYEAHELLEVYWFANRHDKSCEVRVIKGFINAAVSFELFQRGKVSQSDKVWQNYLRLVVLEDLIYHPNIDELKGVKTFLDDYNVELKNPL
jgi:hypothetical protein